MIEIKPNIAKALKNAQLQRNLAHTLGNTLKSRDEVVSEVGNWELLREHARQVKHHTLDHLRDYLTQFESNVQTNGGQVFWADSARDAVRFIIKESQAREARRVIKSKSMLGEEIELNHALEGAGFQVTESDLGEFIIQLAGETPAHIVLPALHKSKKEVSELFADKLGSGVTDDITELTAIARKTLRRHFLEADIGISGVNFAVAETGTIVVVENEGNARMSTSAPRLHFAVMGIEKVIPRMADLPIFLKLLTRSATGQRITSYVNLISGPRKDEERDGPDEFFVVLVDNGRSRIHADPFLRQTLACIRCGACQNICPVFQRIGGHAYGSVYQGPIGAILTPQLLGGRAAPEHAFTSSLCGACKDVCPVKIEIPEILLQLRAEAQTDPEKGLPSALEHAGMRAWSWLMSHTFLFEVSSWVLHRLRHLVVHRGKMRLPIGPFAVWQQHRDLPEIPKRSFRELFRKGETH